MSEASDAVKAGEDEPWSRPTEDDEEQWPLLESPRPSEIDAGLLQLGGAVVPLVTAAGVVAKAKITKSADIRKAEIEAETERQRIAAETQRAEAHEGAETLREAIRQQGQPPAVPPGTTPSTP